METRGKESARQTSWFDNWKINLRRAISGSCERKLYELARRARILISRRGRHLSSLFLSASLTFCAHHKLFHIHGAGSAVLLIPSSRGSRVAKRVYTMPRKYMPQIINRLRGREIESKARKRRSYDLLKPSDRSINLDAGKRAIWFRHRSLCACLLCGSVKCIELALLI